MRILCLNANTTTSITTRVGDGMRRTLSRFVANGDVQVIDCTPSFGPSVIKSRLDLSVSTHAVVDAAVNNQDVDGIMLAVSFDNGRDALREALSIPVIGMTESSVAMARMTGRRIGYVSIGVDITPLYWENLSHCHLQSDLAGWETIEAPAAYQSDTVAEADLTVVSACNRLADQGADVVVLLGAVLADAGHRIQNQCKLPVIDGAAAGALMIRSMIDMQLPKQQAGSFAKRTGGALSGVSVALAKMQQG